MKRIAILALLLVAPIALAQDNSLSLSLVLPQYQSESSTLQGERFPLKLSSRAGFGAGYGHRWGQWSGTIDVRSLRAPGSATIDTQTVGLGNVELTPVTALIRYEAVAGNVVGHAGAGMSWVRTGNLHSADLDAIGTGKINVSDEVTWAVEAGAGFPLPGPLHLEFDARYMPVKFDATARGDKAQVKFNVLTINAGLRWSF